MAEIATYKCSNGECFLTLRLARDFPVWRGDTPKVLRTPAPSAMAKPYVIRYRSETFCIECKKVVEYSDINTCSVCYASIEHPQLGSQCPRCSTGELSMPQLLVY